MATSEGLASNLSHRERKPCLCKGPVPKQNTQRAEAVFVQGPSAHTEWKPCVWVAESLPGFPELWQHGCTELSVSLVSCWLCDCLSPPELPHLKNPVDIVDICLNFSPYTNPQSRPEHSLLSEQTGTARIREEHGNINSVGFVEFSAKWKNCSLAGGSGPPWSGRHPEF